MITFFVSNCGPRPGGVQLHRRCCPRGYFTLFSSRPFRSQVPRCHGIWSRCAQHLAERHRTFEKAYSSIPKHRVTITHQNIADLSRRLLHKFEENGTLATAMVHQSSLSGYPDPQVFAELQPGIFERITMDNVRLALLGDKVIGLLMCDHLMETNPTFNEGQLSQIMISALSNKHMSRYCASLQLDSFLFADQYTSIRSVSEARHFFKVS